jgi:peptidoglycan/LPS O-acetylase OafA/YrhL
VKDNGLAFRADLQGLRAVAILLVLLAHAGFDVAPGGFIGVDIFFVLSGYLISRLLMRELDLTGRIDLLRFYARRLKRLLPALVTMLAVSAGVAFELLSVAEVRAQTGSAPFAITWTSNLFFAFAHLDYFDELAGHDLFLHTWSLGVEEQFYLVWPVLLLMLFRLGKGTVAGTQKGQKDLVSGLAIALVASFLFSLYLTLTVPEMAFYLMPSRIWQLALGGIVFITSARKEAMGKDVFGGRGLVLSHAAFWMGMAFILGSAIGLDRDRAYPGLWALIPSFGAALIILAGHGFGGVRGGPLAHPVLVWVGDRSYSWYLWHWPIYSLGFALGFQGQVVPTLGLMLLSLLVAMLSFRFVEWPFWKGRLSDARPRRSMVVSVGVMGGLILTFHFGLEQLSLQGSSGDISIRWRADVPIIYRMRCDAWYSDSRVEPCYFGVKAAEKTVVLLGDSIGAQWFSMVPEIFKEPYWQTIVLTKSSCPIVDEDFFYKRIGKTYEVCTEWRNEVLKELERLQPDVLIIGNAATYNFDQTQWVEGSARIFARVSKAANAVFVIPGTPSLNFDGPGCVVRNVSPEGRVDRRACAAMDRVGRIEPVVRELAQAADRFGNVYLLDLNDLVCPEKKCNAVSAQGVVVFRDSQHLTDTFVRTQIPFVRRRIEKAGVQLSASNGEPRMKELVLGAKHNHIR